MLLFFCLLLLIIFYALAYPCTCMFLVLFLMQFGYFLYTGTLLGVEGDISTGVGMRSWSIRIGVS